MRNSKYLDIKPVSQDFFVFIEKYYPEYYDLVVKSDYTNIPGKVWSDYWANVYSTNDCHYPLY